MKIDGVAIVMLTEHVTISTNYALLTYEFSLVRAPSIIPYLFGPFRAPVL